MAYSNRAQLHMLADEPEAAQLWGAKAIALATELGDTETESHALNNVGTARLMIEDLAGHTDLERSLQLALAGAFQEHAARAYTNISSTGTRRRDLERANRYLAEGIAYCEEHDLDSWVRYMTAMRAEARLAQGQWQLAADDAEAVLRHPNAAQVSRIPALVVLARVRSRRGDPGAQAPLDEAYRLALATGEPQRIAPVVASRAEVAWLNGVLAETAEELEHWYALAPQHSDHWARGEIAFWLSRAGRLDGIPERIAAPFALQIAGDWSAAANLWGATGCPYEQGLALAECREESAMRAALEIFEKLGAGPMAGIARRRLRASGVRKVPRGAHERTKQNPHGLTNRELNVLALLAEGCRNAEIARRLFVAEKTVDHHVSAVLAKLNVRSRGEAAALANQLGLKAPAASERPAKR
jgi:DNA-binding CsgD family transcriptional regulator